MIIPAEVKLFSQIIKVVLKRDLVAKKGLFGYYDHIKNRIYLQQSTRECKLTNETIHETLIHECTHAMLILMGCHELYEDEKFVTPLSNLIYQLITQI